VKIVKIIFFKFKVVLGWVVLVEVV